MVVEDGSRSHVAVEDVVGDVVERLLPRLELEHVERVVEVSHVDSLAPGADGVHW